MKFIISAMICCSLIGMTFGQKYPFPQNLHYPHGVMPAGISNEFVQTWYDAWKKKYLQECSGNLRPGVDPLTKSLVEAQGFSMIAVAYMGDKDVFDKLFNFYKSKCSASACNLQNWKVNCTGVESNGAGAATDGDVDVACGLVVAHWQWPEDGYDAKLKAVLGNLKKVVVTCGSVSALCGGCSGGSPWGGCNETDISYYEPAFFRYFTKISGDNLWAKLADDTHTIRDAAANKTTGLVPDWQSTSGTAGAGSRVGHFGFDAIRAPYKQSLDYLWNGNEKAEVWCQKISTWANGIGPKNIKDGYQLNGSAQGSNHNMAVVGSLACAAMANTQEVVDAFAAEVIKLKDDYWYSGYLGNLYLLALTGNMWTPELVADKVKNKLSVNHGAVSSVRIRVCASVYHQLTVSGIANAFSVRIADLSGRTVLLNTSAHAEISITTAALPAGCYLLQVFNARQQIVGSKIVSLM